MKNVLTYCIIGAGNGGIAMSGYIASKGYKVNLYNRSIETISELIENPVIYLEGEETGEGRLNLVTDKVEEAILGADIIMVTIPAIGHNDIAKEMAPYLKDGQIIVLNPGRTGGALEVYETLLRERKRNNIIVGEAQTFIYAARAEGNTAYIYKTKKEVSIATIPATKIEHVIELLNHVYPQFIGARDVLETSINNYGAIFHPTPTILNCGLIERGEEFNYYTDGITKTVANILEKMDSERIELGMRLGVETVSARVWLYESYGAKGESIYESVQNNPAYQDLKAPGTLNTRYVHEDVPYSLVPIESIAKWVGMETPAISAIIDMACMMFDKDFREEGRTADKLGLEGLTIDQMHMLAREGKISASRMWGVV